MNLAERVAVWVRGRPLVLPARGSRDPRQRTPPRLPAMRGASRTDVPAFVFTRCAVEVATLGNNRRRPPKWTPPTSADLLRAWLRRCKCGCGCRASAQRNKLRRKKAKERVPSAMLDDPQQLISAYNVARAQRSGGDQGMRRTLQSLGLQGIKVTVALAHRAAAYPQVEPFKAGSTGGRTVGKRHSEAPGK